MDLLDEYGLKAGGLAGERMLTAARMLRKKPFSIDQFRAVLEPMFQRTQLQWPISQDDTSVSVARIAFNLLCQDTPPWFEIKMLIQSQPRYRFPGLFDGLLWMEGADLTGFWVNKLKQFYESVDFLKIENLRLSKADHGEVFLDLKCINYQQLETILPSENVRVVEQNDFRRYVLSNLFPLERFILVRINGCELLLGAERFVDIIDCQTVKNMSKDAKSSASQPLFVYKGKRVMPAEGTKNLLDFPKIALFFDGVGYRAKPIDSYLGTCWSVRNDQGWAVHPFRPTYLPVGSYR
jgi:hypothetical protein